MFGLGDRDPLIEPNMTPIYAIMGVIVIVFLISGFFV